MTSTLPSTGLELRSIITSAGELELSLVNAPMPTPKADEVVVRIEAAPINPSDLGLLLGPADLSTAVASVQDGLPLVKAKIPQGLMKAMASRLDQSMPVGNEGAGVVVATGDFSGGAGAEGQDCRRHRRRHVFAVPMRAGEGLPRASGTTQRRPTALRPSSTR